MSKPGRTTKLERALAIGHDNLAGIITEDVCKLIMSWSGYRSNEAPFELKTDVFLCVKSALETAPGRIDF